MTLNTSKITCIIIDDEASDIALFQDNINRHFKEKLNVVGCAMSVKDGVQLIKKHNPEIIFLDIEMPGENGFKLFEYITEFTFEVIFTTGFQHYAIEAFKYAALDYLVKPIDRTYLSNAIARYERKKAANTSQKRIETFISNLNNGTDINLKVAFPAMDGYYMEKINDILYCEGDVNYTRIHLCDGRMLMVSRTLKEVEVLLSSNYFFRIHKSYLVNLNFIKSYSRSENGITLDNKEKLPVSTRKNDEFLSVLTKWRNKSNEGLVADV